MKKRLKVWTRKQKWHIRTATFQFWWKSFTISWTFRMMLSKYTFCEHEQCSLIKLAFQLVCWDNLGLMVLQGGGALCIWYPQCSVCCDGQRQARMFDFAGPDLVALLAELNSHSAFSANPGGNGAPSLLPERASETGHWATTKSGNKMGSPLGDFPEPGLLWIVKWLPWLERDSCLLSCHCTEYYSNYKNSLAAWRNTSGSSGPLWWQSGHSSHPPLSVGWLSVQADNSATFPRLCRAELAFWSKA